MISQPGEDSPMNETVVSLLSPNIKDEGNSLTTGIFPLIIFVLRTSCYAGGHAVSISLEHIWMN